MSANPSTPLAIMKATQNIRKSMSRENSPVVKVLDYELENDENEQPHENSNSTSPRLRENSNAESPKLRENSKKEKFLQDPGKSEESGNFRSPRLRENSNKGKLSESPLTSLLGPSRKSLAVPKDNLMCFDSPVQGTPGRTPRRSTRLSSAKKINYKESNLLKVHLEEMSALRLRSPSPTKARSPRRSPSPAY